MPLPCRVPTKLTAKAPKLSLSTSTRLFAGSGRDKSLHAFDKYTELKSTWIKL